MRQIVHFYRADPAYGHGVADKLGLDIDQILGLVNLSLHELFQKTSEAGYAAGETTPKSSAVRAAD